MYVQITVHIKAVVQVKSYIYVCSVVTIAWWLREISLGLAQDRALQLSNCTSHICAHTQIYGHHVYLYNRYQVYGLIVHACSAISLRAAPPASTPLALW